jgi:hypothetical protein
MEPSRPLSPLHVISTLFSQYSDFPTGQTNRTEINEEDRSIAEPAVDVGDRVTVINRLAVIGLYQGLSVAERSVAGGLH